MSPRSPDNGPAAQQPPSWLQVEARSEFEIEALTQLAAKPPVSGCPYVVDCADVVVGVEIGRDGTVRLLTA